MKPNIELTSKLNFAGWEGGGFNPASNLGQSVLLAGPTGAKLPVLYEQSIGKVSRVPYHYLFILDVGYLMAQVSVKWTNDLATPEGGFLATVSLSRITSFGTDTVQGSPVPKAITESVFAHRAAFTSKADLLSLDYFKSDSPLRDSYVDFMRAALEKALCDRSSQRLFWGEPRQS